MTNLCIDRLLPKLPGPALQLMMLITLLVRRSVVRIAVETKEAIENGTENVIESVTEVEIEIESVIAVEIEKRIEKETENVIVRRRKIVMTTEIESESVPAVQVVNVETKYLTQKWTLLA
jgi:hypothetical protein